MNITGEQITAVGGAIGVVLTALSPPLTEWIRNRRRVEPAPAQRQTVAAIPAPRRSLDTALRPVPPRKVGPDGRP